MQYTMLILQWIFFKNIAQIEVLQIQKKQQNTQIKGIRDSANEASVTDNAGCTRHHQAQLWFPTRPRTAAVSALQAGVAAGGCALPAWQTLLKRDMLHLIHREHASLETSHTQRRNLWAQAVFTVMSIDQWAAGGNCPLAAYARLHYQWTAKTFQDSRALTVIQYLLKYVKRLLWLFSNPDLAFPFWKKYITGEWKFAVPFMVSKNIGIRSAISYRALRKTGRSTERCFTIW